MLKHLKPFPKVATGTTPPFTPTDMEPIDGSQIPVVQDRGIDYCIVPRIVIRQLKASRDMWFWLCCGTSSVCLAALTAVLLHGPTIVEKPVLVPQEKIVPTNCLLFCGGKQ